MNWLRKFRIRFHALFAKRELDAEMDEEMRAHIEMQTQENIEAGMTPEEARYAALRQFGHVDGIKEACRDQREGLVTRHLALFTQDIRFGWRQLNKHKGSSALAMLILALGIGGTTAVFSVADKVLLNPIPGGDTDRLISVREVDLMHDVHWHSSPPVITELSTHTNEIESVTYCFQGSEGFRLRVGDTTTKLNGVRVAPNFFDVFELRPRAGRTFLAGEGSKGAEKVVVLSHGTWKEFFGGDAETVGKHIELSGETYSVVGIMPANVQFPFGRGYSQLWVPYVFNDEQVHSEWASKNRIWMTTARLREGVELSEVQAMLDVMAARRAGSVTEPNEKWTIQAEPARKAFSNERLRKTVWILLTMMGALLLIACANVGNILLSRTLSRQGEIGIRMAIGAGRMRIARQMLVESLSLAGMAAAFGVFVAWGGIIALERFYLTDLPRINVVGLDWQLLGMTCLVAIVVGAMFGTAPAWIAARTNVNHMLKESSQQHSGGAMQRAFHDGLVVVQVSVAVVLLTGAGLMSRSAVKLLRVDPGLEAEGLYRVYYDAIDYMNTPPYDFQAALDRGVPRSQALKESWEALVDRQFTFQRIALERLHAIPGVEFAAINDNPGFSDYQIAERETPVYLGRATIDVVEGDYLRTIGAKLVAGRLLTAEDAQPGRREVVINEEMARVCWPGQSPLGKRIRSQDGEDTYLVAGVIKNIKDWMLESESKPVFYEPYERVTKSISGGLGDYVIRSSIDPEALREAVVQAGKELMAPLDLQDFYSVKSRLRMSTAPRRVMMWLLLSLAGLGLLLSALGVYAVLAYSVARRTREVGIRMAVGADRRRIRILFMRCGVRLIANGLILGIVAAVTGGHYIRSLLYQVEPADPWSLAAVVVILGTVAGLACWLPARRAANVNPMEALRYE